MDFRLRTLENTDYFKGYLELLEQYFIIGPVSNEYVINFNNYVSKLDNNKQIYVIEINEIKIVGSITIFIEDKLIRNMGKVAHIEDLVVDKNIRGMGFGKLLVNKCIEHAKNMNCYKIILNCNENNMIFYEKQGFQKNENQMALYF